jgi:hypothetical protein
MRWIGPLSPVDLNTPHIQVLSCLEISGDHVCVWHGVRLTPIFLAGSLCEALVLRMLSNMYPPYGSVQSYTFSCRMRGTLRLVNLLS